MFENKKESRQAAKWAVAVISACIVIYLGIANISSIAGAVTWCVNLCLPMLLGLILALILNVPMSAIESKLFQKTSGRMRNAKRPLSILFALIAVAGIFIGVAVLVVPELASALKIIVDIAADGLDYLAQMEAGTSTAASPFGEYLQKMNIDWMGLKVQLQQWFASIGKGAVNAAAGAVGSLFGYLVTLFFSLIFAIYILARKEELKAQVSRLLRVWLPGRASRTIIHVAEVCNSTFKNFISGQAMEAVILGSLCTLGMVILRLPYAPMVGALVGVTALIPIVGAFIGTVVGAVMIITVSPVKAAIFVVFLLILQQIEGNLIYPRVVGSRINLPAIWVLAAVTIGGNLAGPFGMLLGVPAASAAYALLREATAQQENHLRKE